jgi:A/G-specific adenine glycosylase
LKDPGDEIDRLLPARIEASRFRESLARWYARHRRDLPWRKTRDPYAIWVSEIMLQQTRVETVIPRYGDFLDAFPGPAELAAAREDDVLALWSGLGYYSRARNLHRGARAVVERHGGVFPRTLGEARAIPGVGPYTSAAILSIAHGEPVPVVDGNVTRVLARRHRLDPPDDRRLPLLTSLADALLDRTDPGRHNQAMMELGALVCMPRAPRCAACPVSFDCRAHNEGVAGEYPRPAPRKAPVSLHPRMLLLRDGRGRLLLQLGGWPLLNHLWLPPLLAEEEGDPAALVARRYSPKVAAALGPLREIGAFTHAITHHHIRCRVYTGALGPISAKLPAHLRLARGAELGGMGRSSLLDKALRLEARQSEAVAKLEEGVRQVRKRRD